MDVVVLVPQAAVVGSLHADGLVGVIPGRLVNDGLMSCRVEPSVVAKEPLVDGIAHNGGDHVLVKPLAADLLPGPITPRDRPQLRAVAPSVGLVRDGARRTGLDDAAEDEADDGDFLLSGPECLRLLLVVEAERYVATVPQALLSSSGHFRHRPLSGQLPLKLGEAEEDIQNQHAHRVGRVEVLGGRDEGDVVRL
ncbi:MAG TPA: hypothetical protein VFH48_30495 [Chloroflexota bacterium]|nr:hypothetical protein [Chloroflexota bacterium]